MINRKLILSSGIALLTLLGTGNNLLAQRLQPTPLLAGPVDLDYELPNEKQQPVGKDLPSKIAPTPFLTGPVDRDYEIGSKDLDPVGFDVEDPDDNPGPLSTNEIEIRDVSIYPNPSRDFINIDFGSVNGTADIKIFDITGNLVKSVNSYDRNSSISISDLRTGVYIITVNDRAFRFQKI